MRIVQVDQVMCYDRCRDRGIASTAHLPDLLAGIKIISPHMPEAVDYYLCLSIFLINGRCTPGRYFIPGCPPYFIAVFDIEKGQETLSCNIALDDYFSLVDNRRTGNSPFHFRFCIRTRIDHTKVFFP